VTARNGWKRILNRCRRRENRTAGRPGSLAARLVAQDEKSGEPYIKLPLPKPETLRRVLDLLVALAQGK